MIAQTKKSEAPEDVLLAEVIARYWEKHDQPLASSYRTRTALDYWLEFYGEISVSELTGFEQQEAFHVWLKDKGMKASTLPELSRLEKRQLILLGNVGKLPMFLT